jgi:2TM domain
MQYRDDFSRERRVARARIAFGIHLTVYALVNALLIGINLDTSTEHLWFKWPLLGWGIGILAHAVVTFFLPSRMRIRRGLIARQMRKRASE